MTIIICQFLPLLHLVRGQSADEAMLIQESSEEEVATNSCQIQIMILYILICFMRTLPH